MSLWLKRRIWTYCIKY